MSSSESDVCDKSAPFISSLTRPWQQWTAGSSVSQPRWWQRGNDNCTSTTEDRAPNDEKTPLLSLPVKDLTKKQESADLESLKDRKSTLHSLWSRLLPSALTGSQRAIATRIALGTAYTLAAGTLTWSSYHHCLASPREPPSYWPPQHTAPSHPGGDSGGANNRTWFPPSGSHDALRHPSNDPLPDLS